MIYNFLFKANRTSALEAIGRLRNHLGSERLVKREFSSFEGVVQRNDDVVLAHCFEVAAPPN